MFAILSLLFACGPTRTTAETWEVFAIDYGRSTYSRAKLIDGETGGREPFAWTSWVIRGPDRLIVVDTGFASQDVAKKWKIEGFVPVPELLSSWGVTADEVTDVVVTHAHWDHMGNLGAFPTSRVWIQREAYEWAKSRLSEERPERSGMRLKDFEQVELAMATHRLLRPHGDREIATGVTLHTGGGHTPGIQWVEVEDGPRTIVLASDIAYLYENIKTPIAASSTTNGEADLTQINLMKNTAKPPHLLLPGHDPKVFDTFPAVARRVHEVK